MNKATLEILTTYAIVAVCGIIGGIPTYDMQNISMMLTVFVLVMLYIIRSREKSDSLLRHHTTFMIRTIWIYSLFYTIALCAAVYTIYQIGDISTITSMTDSIQQGAIPGHDDMEATVIQFMSDNQNILISWLSLPMFYIVLRVVRGASRAYHNYRVLNIYSWF